MPLDPRFQLAEASLTELDEMFTLMEIATADDEMVKHAFRDVKQEDLHPWNMKTFAPMYAGDHMKIYKITEVATG